MAGGEGTSEDFKQAVPKGKAKQPTQGYDAISVSPGRSSLPKSLAPIAELTPGRSSLRKSLLLPIAELTPGQTITNWEIQGLVVCKSEVKPYTNGDGKYFSFEMRDQAGGEIRVVSFQGEVTRFFKRVVEGKEHVLTRGKLIKPKERFNRMNRRCEIVLEYDSEIRVLEEEEEEEEEKHKSLLERMSEIRILEDEEEKHKSLLERVSEIRILEDEEGNNKSLQLLERVTEIQKTLEFCTSKLQELETEIKKAGKMGNPAAGTTSFVKMEAPGVSGNRAQAAEKKIGIPTRGAGLGTPTRVSLPRM